MRYSDYPLNIIALESEGKTLYNPIKIDRKNLFKLNTIKNRGKDSIYLARLFSEAKK